MITRLQCAKLAVGLALVAVGVWLSGCAARQETLSLYEVNQGKRYEGGGGTPEAVFDSPEAQAVAMEYGREALPEYARLDGTMNRYEPTAITATSQWPQEARPDLSNVQWVYFPAGTSSSVQVVPVIRREGDSRWGGRGWGGHGGHGYWNGDGRWGSQHWRWR